MVDIVKLDDTQKAHLAKIHTSFAEKTGRAPGQNDSESFRAHRHTLVTSEETRASFEAGLDRIPVGSDKTR